MKHFPIRAALAPLLLPLVALAQVPTTPPPRAAAAELAAEAAQHAMAVCARNGYKVAVSIVDAAGGTRAMLIADGAITLLGDYATRKAVAAATFKEPTSRIEQRMKSDPALSARINAEPNRYFTRAGGVPLLVGGETIGAIGVGGAPDSAQDEICALAAVAKIQDRLK